MDKRVVETGRAVIHKSVSERDEAVNALLARHDVTVERVPVGQVVSELPAPRQDGDTWIIPIMEERLVVEKQLVLKEELRIRTTTRHEAVQHTVRLREENVDIEAVDHRLADPAAAQTEGDAR
ncbi:MAG: YsnF/AvaK domain-containing protein [Acetobacteraceae bacterium]|nr:YsnF/AvaK domain-containing protein [Acetobacteraceae bacterium]